MNKALAVKVGIIFLIAILLNIPLSMIADQTDERSEHKYYAYNSIATSWTRSQKVVGPFLKVPYVLEVERNQWDANLKAYVKKTNSVNRVHWVTLDNVTIDTKVDMDKRARGIYEVPVYTAYITLRAQLKQDVLADIKHAHKNLLSIGEPVLSMAVSDPRGINSIPELTIKGETQGFQPGSLLDHNANGIHLSLKKSQLVKGMDLAFNLELRGMDKLSFVPIAKEAHMQMRSGWQHPSFIGDFLPVKRTITDTGYQAEWKITSFASNIEEKLKACQKTHCESLLNGDFGVKHIEPVDMYVQVERSVKYGFLFIALSFIAFFLFEVMKRMAIHSIQYTLVGLAVAIFYLLLLALSEHISFALSYVIAAAACIGLLQLYLSAMLKSTRQALVFSGIFTLLYGILYGIIQAEDFALLMGSLLTFMALGILMLSTRHVDWFKVGEQLGQASKHKRVSGEQRSSGNVEDDNNLLI